MYVNVNNPERPERLGKPANTGAQNWLLLNRLKVDLRSGGVVTCGKKMICTG